MGILKLSTIHQKCTYSRKRNKLLSIINVLKPMTFDLHNKINSISQNASVQSSGSGGGTFGLRCSETVLRAAAVSPSVSVSLRVKRIISQLNIMPATGSAPASARLSFSPDIYRAEA